MSRTSGLRLELEAPNHGQVDLLDLLIDHGWSPNWKGQTRYLPLHDDGDFDWKNKPQSEWSHVRSILREKESLSECLGLQLIWQETGIGGLFHFEIEESRRIIWTIWNAERPRLSGCDWLADQSWFIERIVPPFVDEGIHIQLCEGQDLY